MVAVLGGRIPLILVLSVCRAHLAGLTVMTSQASQVAATLPVIPVPVVTSPERGIPVAVVGVPVVVMVLVVMVMAAVILTVMVMRYWKR
ncbi:hypothetical protein EL06_28025 [Salmonella enterica subsp. diarizonae]|uniref:Uncharacterized protein n=1 Tax=Salmonella diarizonae TaxID=59204 RepID=A0A6C8Y612_SALDZ|nr:hypothetical protein [Salmonella enterica subsp. diarizonae]